MQSDNQKLSKTKANNRDQFRYASSYEFPEAYKKNKNILALERDGETYSIAQILKISKQEKQGESTSNYSYYVTYLGQDKRYDQWIDEMSIKTDVNEIAAQQKNLGQKRQRKFLPSNENENLDEQTVKWYGTRIKNIQYIQLGDNAKTEAHYRGDVPAEFSGECLYICSVCLEFIKEQDFEDHKQQCYFYHPPGQEIYRDNDISCFEVDGYFESIYCEQICRLTSFFLEHKTNCDSIENAVFYIICKYSISDGKYHFQGMFSRYKHLVNQNLSCIMSIPGAYMGQKLIEISYALAVQRGNPGTPERPFSDLGHKAFVKYWTRTILPLILQMMRNKENISIDELAKRTGILQTDIDYIMNHLKIKQSDEKLCSKKHISKLISIAGGARKSIDLECFKVNKMKKRERKSIEKEQSVSQNEQKTTEDQQNQ